MRILVTTPTGNIGSRIADQLFAAGHPLTLLARDPSRLSDALRSRSTVVEGSIDNAVAVSKALADVDTAFLLIPPQNIDPHWRAWQESVGAAFVAAATQAKLSRVVFISSTGSQHEGLGPISGTGAVERMLTAALPNVVIVRAGGFMENTFGSLPTIAAQGAMYGVLPGDSQQQNVATRDIADVATRWLTDATWSGHHTVGAHGPTTISPNEMASVLSDVLGRPVSYVQIPGPAFREALLQAGLPAFVAGAYEEMYNGIAHHMALGDYSQEPQSPATAGKTSFREFAQQSLKPVFEKQFAAGV